jgi:Uma2 family endonuclease
MSVSLQPHIPEDIDYPESDGQPMADNTRQFRWIVVLFGNLAAWFRDDPNVFVSGNQFWYPVKGNRDLSVAPDVYVVFGRPKGDRGSYKQWEEGEIPMTVVFEVLSPRNTTTEMANKFVFYQKYGVEEYYVYDPDRNELSVYVRQGKKLAPVEVLNEYASLRLGIRFEMTEPEMKVFLPDGRPFRTFEDLERELSFTQKEAKRAEQQAKRAEQQAKRAEQRAKRAEQRSEEGERRFVRLIELNRRARQGRATPEELEELNRLEEGSSGS